MQRWPSRTLSHVSRSLGDGVAPRSSAEFSKLVQDDIEKWANVIHSANIKLEQ